MYTLPFFKHGHSLGNTLLGRWELSGIVSAYTGQPLQVATSSIDPAGLGLLGDTSISNRPDEVCNPNEGAPHQYAAVSQNVLWFKSRCFTAVPQGQVRPGNAGTYTLAGPGFYNLDASLMKNFNLAREGRWKLQVRVEGFNILNAVNPGGVASVNITATNFGQINSFRAARRMQLAAKINF